MKLTYFDIDGGRGEAARLAMTIGGIAFEDDRLPFPRFRELRTTMPFFRIPILEVDGVQLTQSNAINRYVGKLAGLYPEDPFTAARCDEVMEAVEDVVMATVATFPIADEDEKKAARAKLVEFPMAVYLKRLAAMLEGAGDTFVDGRLTVADLKVFVWVRSLQSGIVDYVPTDIVATHAPALVAHNERVAAHPPIAAYYAARSSAS